MTGDGSVSARVATQTNTSSNAKAGVMLRSSTDPGAPNYAVLVSPGAGIKVQERNTLGGATVKLANPTGTTPAFLKVTRAGNTFSAYTSPDGTTWNLIAGSTFTMALGPTLLEGLAATSHAKRRLEHRDHGQRHTTGRQLDNDHDHDHDDDDEHEYDHTATSTSTTTSTTTAQTSTTSGSTTTLPLDTCPTSWSCADIGNPTPTGGQSYDPNTSTWTLTAGGNDISATSDQFHYVWTTLTGDGSVSARVATQTNTSSNAKAGVMLRASTDPGAPNYAVLVSPGAGIKVQERNTLGGTTVKLANPTGTTPAFLKVTRAGQHIQRVHLAGRHHLEPHRRFDVHDGARPNPARRTRRDVTPQRIAVHRDHGQRHRELTPAHPMTDRHSCDTPPRCPEFAGAARSCPSIPTDAHRPPRGAITESSPSANCTGRSRSYVWDMTGWKHPTFTPASEN